MKHMMVLSIPFEADSLVEVGKTALKLEEEIAPLRKSHPGMTIEYRQTRETPVRSTTVRRGRAQRAPAPSE